MYVLDIDDTLFKSRVKEANVKNPFLTDFEVPGMIGLPFFMLPFHPSLGRLKTIYTFTREAKPNNPTRECRRYDIIPITASHSHFLYCPSHWLH